MKAPPPHEIKTQADGSSVTEFMVRVTPRLSITVKPSVVKITGCVLFICAVMATCPDGMWQTTRIWLPR